MGSPAPPRWLIALAVLAVALAAFMWLRKRGGGSALDDFKPPLLLDVVALDPDGASRPLSDHGQLTTRDRLDFHVQLPQLSYVYVFSVANDKVRFDWGHGPLDPAWEAGVYEPDWSSSTRGLGNLAAGKLELHVLATPTPVAGAPEWTLEKLRNFRSVCPRCEEAQLSFEITQAP